MPGFDNPAMKLEYAIPKELLCSVCTFILKDPIELTCKHVMCLSCIADHCYENLGSVATCPVCKDVLLMDEDLNSIYFPREDLKRCISNIKGHCGNTYISATCNWEGPPDLWMGHSITCPVSAFKNSRDINITPVSRSLFHEPPVVRFVSTHHNSTGTLHEHHCEAASQ